MPDELCHCGKPLHYRDQELKAKIEQLIALAGDPCVVIRVLNLDGTVRSWKVPRHYIALHGIVGSQLPKMGFTEVKRDDSDG